MGLTLVGLEQSTYKSSKLYNTSSMKINGRFPKKSTVKCLKLLKADVAPKTGSPVNIVLYAIKKYPDIEHF